MAVSLWRYQPRLSFRIHIRKGIGTGNIKSFSKTKTPFPPRGTRVLYEIFFTLSRRDNLNYRGPDPVALVCIILSVIFSVAAILLHFGWI